MVHIVCLGIAARDLVFRVSRLPTAGEKLLAQELLRVGGGMSASASVAAARLGARVAFWGRLGDDLEGQALRAELRGYGVDVPAPAEPGTQTPTAAILVDDHGERLLAVHRGRLNDDPGWLPLQQLAQAQAVLADMRWPSGAQALLSAARRQRVPSVLDADQGDPDTVRRLLPVANHAVFSEAGLQQTAGHGDLERALREMQALGPAVAGVTLGERGSLFMLDGQMQRVPAFSVSARDTNGAGDVFHAAYTVALAEGQTVLDAARFASAAAACKCRNGTGWAASPGRAEVAAVLGTGPGH